MKIKPIDAEQFYQNIYTRNLRNFLYENITKLKHLELSDKFTAHANTIITFVAFVHP